MPKIRVLVAFSGDTADSSKMFTKFFPFSENQRTFGLEVASIISLILYRFYAQKREEG
jgi:hypothetical protein